MVSNRAGCRAQFGLPRGGAAEGDGEDIVIVIEEGATEGDEEVAAEEGAVGGEVAGAMEGVNREELT